MVKSPGQCCFGQRALLVNPTKSCSSRRIVKVDVTPCGAVCWHRTRLVVPCRYRMRGCNATIVSTRTAWRRWSCCVKLVAFSVRKADTAGEAPLILSKRGGRRLKPCAKLSEFAPQFPQPRKLSTRSSSRHINFTNNTFSGPLTAISQLFK